MDAAGFAVKPFGAVIETDILDHGSYQFIIVQGRRGRNLTKENHEARLDSSLTSNAGVGILFHNGIHDGVADLIAHLVGVPLRYRFTGKKKRRSGHKGAAHFLFS